ncbi:uncharacterized protein LOC121005860 [Bufo bufo]|uniref:uncharacterized protein LOC121005860 n=1 Tax=Bufo bufo TaxID=8384 RepID=UPI001ABE30CD|nr:uncharacterized protein LOC121005860 [Bufo bufo]
MSEKDSISSQDIPIVLRALGTLALAAVTAVAIRWFISCDKAEKDKGKSTFQGNQEPTDDGQSPRYDPKADEEILENNTKEPQVSDEQGITFSGFDCFSGDILKSSTDTSCPNIVDIKEDRQCLTDHQGLLGDLTPLSCKLDNVEEAQSGLHNLEGAIVSISGVLSETVDDKTNYTQKEVFSSCFTQTCDKKSYESSQEQQLNTRTSSLNGECADVMNVECQGYKSHPTGDDNMVSELCLKHKIVNVSLDEDLFNKDTCEMNGNLYCDSDINIENHANPCVEKNDNMSRSASGMNLEDYTKEHINKRENPVNTYALGLPPSQESTNIFIGACSLPSHEVLTRCHNTEQQTIYTTFNMQDIPHTIDVIQEAKQTTKTLSSENTVITNTVYKGEKLYFKHKNHITCAQQSTMEHTICVTSEDILEEANENMNFSSIRSFPASTHISEEHLAVQEKNGKSFSSVHNNPNGKLDGQIADGSQNPMELLYLPKAGAMDGRKIKNTISHHANHVLQWNTTTVHNSTEFIDLMYPLDFQAPENSITPLIEKNEGLIDREDTTSLLTEKSISMCTEREYNNLDADVENSFESSTCHNMTHNEPAWSTKSRNMVYHPSILNTFKSTVVSKSETQSVQAMSSEKNNDVIYSLHTHDANLLTVDKNKFCTVITKGYFSRYDKQDYNTSEYFSTKYKPDELFGIHETSSSSIPLSNFMQNAETRVEESSCRSSFSCNDSHTVSSVMMDLSKSELKCQDTMQAIKKDDHLFKENLNVRMMEETTDSADSLKSPAQNLGQGNLDYMDSISSDPCSGQVSITSFSTSAYHNEEQDKSLQSRYKKGSDTVESDLQSFSREKIMSTIAETSELILPEYQSVFTSQRKKPLMTKSCDNIYSGPSSHESAMKNKAQSMLCLLTEYYTTKLHSLEKGPLEEVARGCFIRIPKGFQNIHEGVRFQLTLGNCLELLKLARKNGVPELLKAIYTLISDNYLNVLKNSAIYGQLTGLEREKILQLRMRGKLSLCIIETQSIFGLNKNISRSEDIGPDQPKDQLYSLDMDSNQWTRVTNIPEEACLKGCSICSMQNYLFIAGGIQKTERGLCSNKLFCYNPLTDIWTQLTPMNQARSQLKLVPLDGYLYAIGGECLHTMERYDPRSNKWTFVASLPKGSFAVAHEAAACGGELYISGGHLFYRLLKYNPVRDLWEECPFNASKGRSCDMVAVGHILYRFDMHKDSTVHIFKYNTTAKVWSEYTTTFPNSKVPFRCAVLDGTIYCLNREMTARFSLEEEKAMFESTLFNKVPTKGVGYPCPVVLSLQGSLSQTSV